MKRKAKNKFAWLPRKLTNGAWVWLRYYEHTIITEPRPLVRAIMDPDYIHTCVKNIRAYHAKKENQSTEVQ